MRSRVLPYWLLISLGTGCFINAQEPFNRADRLRMKNERFLDRAFHMVRHQIGGFAREDGPCVYPFQINLIDRARFSAATLLVQKGEHDEAMAELTHILEQSPDENAVSAAHLSIGNIKRERFGDVQGAIAEYAQVRGFLASHAAEGVSQAYGSLGRNAEAARAVEKLIHLAEGNRTKALILITLAHIQERSGEKQAALATLRTAPDVIGQPDVAAGMVNFAELLAQIAELKQQGKEREAQELIETIRNPLMLSRMIWAARKAPRRAGWDFKRNRVDDGG